MGTRKKIILSLVVCLVLAGCESGAKFGAVLAFKEVALSKAADKMLDDSIEKLCKYPTIGSLERQFGDNPTKYKQYHKFCHHDSVHTGVP